MLAPKSQAWASTMNICIHTPTFGCERNNERGDCFLLRAGRLLSALFLVHPQASACNKGKGTRCSSSLLYLRFLGPTHSTSSNDRCHIHYRLEPATRCNAANRTKDRIGTSPLTDRAVFDYSTDPPPFPSITIVFYI